MKRKILWISLLILGFVPFLFAIFVGLCGAIDGMTEGFCLSFTGGCTRYYGFRAFVDAIYLYSFIFWFTYILGAALIVASIIIKKKTKKALKTQDDNTIG